MATLLENCSEWSTEEVVAWARTNLGDTTANKLKENNVDGKKLLTLQYPHLLSMEIPAGPRRKFLNAIEKMNGIERPAIYAPQAYKPFHLLKNLISPEDAGKIRQHFAELPSDTSVSDSNYNKLVLNGRVYLPSLEDRLNQMFPDMMVFQTNYFSGDQEKGTYSGWHTGVNLSKLFVNAPNTFTVWIPLQSLTAETGGRLWFYNGEYLDTIVNMLQVTNKKTMLYQYVMLGLFEKELDRCKVTDDCQLGDGFMFWEMNPHCVDSDCTIKREVISVRLISRNAVMDNDFIKELEDFPEDETINFLDNKRALMSLHSFLVGTRQNYERSLEIEKERKVAK